MQPEKVTPFDYFTTHLGFQQEGEAHLPYTSIKVLWFTSPQFPAKTVYLVRGNRESEIASLFFKIPKDCFLLVGSSLRIKEYAKITELPMTKLPEVLSSKRVIDLRAIIQSEENLRQVSTIVQIDPQFHSLLKVFESQNMTAQLRIDREWQFLIVQYKPSSPATRADLIPPNIFPITFCLKAPVSSDELDNSFYKYALRDAFYFRARTSDVFPLVLVSWYCKKAIPVKWDFSEEGKSASWTYRSYFSAETIVVTTTFEKMLDENLAYQPAYFRAFIPSMLS